MLTVSGSIVRVDNDALAAKTAEGIFVKIVFPSTFTFEGKVEPGEIVTVTGPCSIERGRGGKPYLRVTAHFLRLDGKRVL
jgi:hypothetical protein